MVQKNKHAACLAFTIIELLIVIGVIAILTTIGTVVYVKIQATARDYTRNTNMTVLAEALERYHNTNGEYPSCEVLQEDPNLIAQDVLIGIDTKIFKAPQASSGIVNSIICDDISSTNDDVYAYISAEDDGYSCTSWLLQYRSEETGEITEIRGRRNIDSGSVALSCPSGFITVPGNSLFGTEDFCVMKYEAKDDGDHMISQASGSPSIWWTQTGATTYAQEVENCTGCHLITENEWLTIAHNALNVASNWSSGQVGTGYIYSGNNHASRTAASTNDNDGYYGVDEATYPTDRRTLTLSNGQVIWDLAGNAWEWTSGTITGNQPGDTNWVFREYNSIADPKDLDYAFPSYGTPAATNWTSANGIGKLYTNSSISTIRGCSRGGWWNDSPAEAGIFSLSLYHAPSDGPAIGFRSAAPGQ
jgi:type II secretory pathway pseudopilin PulG